MPRTSQIKAGKGHGGDGRFVTYEFQIYVNTLDYGGDLMLVATIDQTFKNDGGGTGGDDTEPQAEEFVRNIGMFGVTVEDMPGHWVYYPPVRIAKIDFYVVPTPDS